MALEVDFVWKFLIMDILETLFRTAIIHPRKYTHSTCNTGHPVPWVGMGLFTVARQRPGCIVWLRDKPHHPQQITARDR